MKNRILSMVLIIVLLLALLPVQMIQVNAFHTEKFTISAGYKHTMALKSDGTLWAFGRNNEGELGDGTTTIRYTPVHIMTGIASVSAGLSYTMALKTDGTLWAFGRNDDGRLGDGTNAHRHTPVQVMTGIVSVSAGWGHTMALKTNGTLWAFGNNDDGQLGDGTTINRNTPVKIMTGIASVSAGSSHTMALKTDGTLWAFGNNSEGRLGDGTTINRHTPIQVMTGITSVSAGWYHTMALKTDGTLWAFGNNDYGALGDETATDSYIPVKVMTEIASVSASWHDTMALKTDGTLWAFGANDYSQLGDGTTTDRHTPVQVMTGIASVSAGYKHTMALKTDGILWAFGDNSHGQLGDGTTTNRNTPVQIMTDVMLPNNTIPAVSVSYLYDIIDPGSSIILPSDKLVAVTDQNSAVSAVQFAVSGLTAGQKSSATGVDQMTLFAEETVAQAARTEIAGGGIVVNQGNVTLLQDESDQTKAAVVQALSSSGIMSVREIRSDVKFTTKETENVRITIESSAAQTSVDNIRIETPAYTIAVSLETIKAHTQDSPLIINVTENTVASINPYMQTALYSRTLASLGREGIDRPNASSLQNSITDRSDFTVAAGTGGKSYKITFNKTLTDNLKVSLISSAGDPTYQAVTKANGTAVGGKFNPATQRLEVRIKDSDTYMVKENKKNFSDVAVKSNEMQQAINILSSKGIINGTTATTFSPDGAITRAEIASLIVRTLSKLDPGANGAFVDVKTSDWFFASVGSAKKYGIINGVSSTIFSPKAQIKKDQIVAVCARTLRNEMKYTNPADSQGVLGVYADSKSIPAWGVGDISLATRENLVVKRSDSKFNPAGTMTRGDAAIILYRMFMKIW